MEILAAKGIQTLELDVTSSSSIDSVKAHIGKITDGTLDMLVNNA